MSIELNDTKKTLAEKPKMTINPLVEKFLKSRLYAKLFSMGWQLVHQSVIQDWVKQTRKPAYIPKGAKGFIFIDKTILEAKP